MDRKRYDTFFKKWIYFILAMLTVSLASGFVYQESVGSLAWGQVAIEHRMGATAMLAQMHGHLFALGVYLPTTLCLLLYLSSRIGAKEIAVVHLRVLTGMYHTGMTCTLALLIYKGYHFLGSVRGGITDFALIDATMFGGNAALREVFHAIAHGLLAAALIYFCVLLARSVHAARIGGYRPGS